MIAHKGLHAMSRLLFGPRFPLPGGAARGARLKTQFPTYKTNAVELIRNLPGRVVAALEAPATGRFAEQSRSIYTGTSPSISQRLSLPARLAVNRPLAAPRLPRVAPVPRAVSDVGLGAARNFSSRPVFQHLVENVPIALRSATELDLDPRVRKPKAKRLAGRPTKRNAQAPRRKALAPVNLASPAPEASVVSDIESEFAHYFPAAASSTITFLTIPLQPTATRSPLPEPREDATPLDLMSFVPTMSAYQDHRLRVDSLFDRLSLADVWKRGASSTTHDAGSGIADVIQVRFDGWSAADVKKVLGHAGEGWCTIEERSNPPVERDAAAVEDEWNTLRESMMHPQVEDSQVTLVLPTLDFSARVLDRFDSASTSPDLTRPSSPLTEFTVSENDSYFHSFVQHDGTICADHDLLSEFGSDSDFDTTTWSAVSRRF
ncbi:hypothetical protein RhiJN_14449 [Ceratobasidium sp. AG-Ba]|nr:hypothetical protein RhiJN_14449 [Ceratobasidium sp. AG-Ba]